VAEGVDVRVVVVVADVVDVDFGRRRLGLVRSLVFVFFARFLSEQHGEDVAVLGLFFLA